MNSETFRKNIKQILIPEADLQAKIKEVGAQISKEYDGKPLLLVSILNGAFVFMADLCRAITIPCETAFMCAKSYYSGTVSTGVVKITMDLQQDISNYHVIIAEDIIDTGRTLNDVKKMLLARNPLSLKIITLLPFGRPQSRPLSIYHSGLVCHWLWAGLRRTLPQSSIYCRI